MMVLTGTRWEWEETARSSLDWTTALCGPSWGWGRGPSRASDLYSSRGKPGAPLGATGNLRPLGDQPIQVCISHLLEKARFCPDRAQGRSRPPALYRSRLEQEAEASPKRRTSSFCADRESAWARFLTLRPAVSSIFCEMRGWWLSVGALRNTSRHVDTLSVRVIEFNGWAQAHPDTTRTPSVH